MKLYDVYPLYNVELVRAAGNYVYDQNGTAYLDLYGGHAVISIGHAHPHYVARLEQQLRTLSFYSNSVRSSIQETLAEKLGQLSGCPEYNLFLCNSGAEANENALKLASFRTQKTKVLAFKSSFHGRTSAAVNATDSNKIKAPINTTFEVEFLPLNDVAAAAQALSHPDVAAVIVEGVQGIGGIYIPSDEFLQQLSQLCTARGIPLILDEIQSGYGRTGQFFAFQSAGIRPDLITVAKGMGNGFPVGGVLIHPSFEAKSGQLGTTFGGNHLACAASLAVLEVLEQENLIEKAAELGDYWMECLKQVPGVKDVRGKGLMIGVEFETAVAPLTKRLIYEEHIFTGTASNPNVMRLLPPLTATKAEVDLFMEKLEKSVGVLEGAAV
jgi:acetylornithine/N-succinyldiaminopimelate aminotransferase